MEAGGATAVWEQRFGAQTPGQQPDCRALMYPPPPSPSRPHVMPHCVDQPPISHTRCDHSMPPPRPPSKLPPPPYRPPAHCTAGISRAPADLPGLAQESRGGMMISANVTRLVDEPVPTRIPKLVPTNHNQIRPPAARPPGAKVAQAWGAKPPASGPFQKIRSLFPGSRQPAVSQQEETVDELTVAVARSWMGEPCPALVHDHPGPQQPQNYHKYCNLTRNIASPHDTRDKVASKTSLSQFMQTQPEVPSPRHESPVQQSPEREEHSQPEPEIRQSDFEIVIDGPERGGRPPSSLRVKPDGPEPADKSSSESSGRGTLTPAGSLETPHPDSSIDSDGGQLAPDQREQGGWTPVMAPSQSRHSYRHLENQGYSFPQAGTSPAPSPEIPFYRDKLSYSTTSLTTEKPKKSGRRTSATLPSSCRHWEKPRRSSRTGSSKALGAMYPSDPELQSTTTTAQDSYSSSEDGSDATEVGAIRRQLEGLESMYTEILRLLGVKGDHRKRVHGSLSSLTGRSSNSMRHHRRREKNSSSDRRRLQRLESHVVSLARSVGQLSGEARRGPALAREVESLRREVSWLQRRVTQLGPDWERLRREVAPLVQPGRVRKLTKFFGDEPPLLKQFLKNLGYEKYAPLFESERIGITELPYLTEDRLQKLGVPMGPRLRILEEAHSAFRRDAAPAVYIV